MLLAVLFDKLELLLRPWELYVRKLQLIYILEIVDDPIFLQLLQKSIHKDGT